MILVTHGIVEDGQQNNGAESIEEVYQMLEHGEQKSWKHLMIGFNNEVFYEEPVDKVSQQRVGKDLDLL